MAETRFTEKQVELIKAISNANLKEGSFSDIEFAIFMNVVNSTGLDPLTREIYAMRVKGRLSILVGIDGYIKLANESGKFRGLTQALLTVEDDKKEIRVIPEPEYVSSRHALCSATIGVRHADDTEPTWVTCRLEDYSDSTNYRWRGTTKAAQLVKCATGLALRRRFAGLEGTNVPEEIDHLLNTDGGESQKPPKADKPRVSKAEAKAAETEAKEMSGAVQQVVDKFKTHLKGKGSGKEDFVKCLGWARDHFHVGSLTELEDEQAAGLQTFLWTDAHDRLFPDESDTNVVPPEESNESE